MMEVPINKKRRLRRIFGTAPAAALLLTLLGASAMAQEFPRLGVAGEYHPGKFIWFDLVTGDLASARRFYGAVFGWRFATVDNVPASYTVVHNANRSIAGMFERKPPDGAASGARWLSLISSRDPASIVRHAEQQGGAALVAPATIAGRGTHALFRDPEGAVIGILKSETGDPPDTPVADGDFFWVDLLARDPAKQASFYRYAGGYQINETEAGKRRVLAAGGYARAGIVPLPPGVKQSGWLPYVLVSDVRATLEKVRGAGGRVLVEPRAELLAGNVAVIADPSGGVLGIVNWVMP